MTAHRDRYQIQFALDLGYEEIEITSDGHQVFVHSETGVRVCLPPTFQDRGHLQSAMNDLRAGAGLNLRGRAAVVNAKGGRRLRKGENSARLRREKERRDYLAEVARRTSLTPDDLRRLMGG